MNGLYYRERMARFALSHRLTSDYCGNSREGIVAPTTQIDAGYYGTLNWTLTNTSSEERRFVHKERIFRLTILSLDRATFTPAFLSRYGVLLGLLLLVLGAGGLLFLSRNRPRG
jgi:hypothetical protein